MTVTVLKPSSGLFEGNLAETRAFLEKGENHRFLTIDMDRFNFLRGGLIPAVETLLPLMAQFQQDRYAQKFQALVDALVPDVELPARAVREAKMLARARQHVIEGAEWLTAAEAAELAGFSKTNPSAGPGRWKKQGLIFTITHDGTEYFPAYGLDPKTQYRPRPILAELIAMLSSMEDGWDLAYWFAGVNSYLGGRRPQDCLESIDRPMGSLSPVTREVAGTNDIGAAEEDARTIREALTVAATAAATSAVDG